MAHSLTSLTYASVTSDGRVQGECPKAKALGRSAWASGAYCSPVVPLYVPCLGVGLGVVLAVGLGVGLGLRVGVGMGSGLGLELGFALYEPSRRTPST